MARRDPLAAHYRHNLIVRHLEGQGAYGKVLGTPTHYRGAVDDTSKLVRTAGGNEVVASSSVAFPASTPWIEPGSEVTLPESYGGRTAVVLTTSRADGGGLRTPDHLAVTLE